VSYSRLAPSAAVNEGSLTNTPAMIWATSQYVDITVDIADDAIFTDAVLKFGATTTTYASVTSGCGLHYANNRWRFGIKCDATAGVLGTAAVEYDVAVHTYIMGFHYIPDAGSVGSALSVKAEYNGFVAAGAPAHKYELVFYDDAAGNRDRDFINQAWDTANVGGTAP
jgi:hypothetical protein